MRRMSDSEWLWAALAVLGALLWLLTLPMPGP